MFAQLIRPDMEAAPQIKEPRGHELTAKEKD